MGLLFLWELCEGGSFPVLGNVGGRSILRAFERRVKFPLLGELL